MGMLLNKRRKAQREAAAKRDAAALAEKTEAEPIQPEKPEAEPIQPEEIAQGEDLGADTAQPESSPELPDGTEGEEAVEGQAPEGKKKQKKGK